MACRPRRVCLFGLSADPPTGQGGHVSIVQALLEQQPQWDFVCVLPVFRHVYESKQHRLLSFEHRFRMCELAFGHLDPSPSYVPAVATNPSVSTTPRGSLQLGRRLVLSDAERQVWWTERKYRSNDTFSIGTARLLESIQTTPALLLPELEGRAHEPHHGANNTARAEELELHLCLGADAFDDLVRGKWLASDQILQRVTGFVLVPRNDSGAAAVDPKFTTDNGTERFSGRITVLQLSPSTNVVSSSRARACTTVEELDELVVPAVREYIRQHGLYGLASS